MTNSAARSAASISFPSASSATAAAALLLVVASIGAVEPTPPHVQPATRAGEWRLIAAIAPAYAVEEDYDGSSGWETYDWQGTGEQAPLIAAQYQRPLGDGSWSWGVELYGSWRELRPSSYELAGATVGNPDGEHLIYHTATLALLLTWHALQPEDERLSLFVDAQASLGPTMLTARLINGSGSDRSFGYGGDGAVRLIAGLAERRWLGAMLIGWHHGYAVSEIEIGPRRSELWLERSGAELGLVVGHRW